VIVAIVCVVLVMRGELYSNRYCKTVLIFRTSYTRVGTSFFAEDMMNAAITESHA
jgi:hypothetical protein